MNSWSSISEDVKLGENVRLAKFVNLYGCEIGDGNEDWRLRRNPEERPGREALQDIEPLRSYVRVS